MSTVLDVSVALLLVGAALATLAVGTPTPESTHGADAARVTSRLATVTATVQRPPGRRTHETLAGHLANAAVVGARIDGRRVSRSAYPESVRNRIESLVDDRTFVTADWRPYPDAELTSDLIVGEPPPSSADVTATKMVVHSGIAPPTEPASFESLARVLAARYVRRLFPPERTRAALVDPRTAHRTRERYRAVADALGVEVGGLDETANTLRVNEVLADALADRFETSLGERYETPRTAARNVRVDDVRIVVRRWES